MRFAELNRWDPGSFSGIHWQWMASVMTPIGNLLTLRKEKIDLRKTPFEVLQPVSVHFDGSISKRKLESGRSYSMDMYSALPGDFIVSKIDLKNGAVAIAPTWENMAVTSHFAIYAPDESRLYPPYLHRLIQARFFKTHLWNNKVGAEGRKEVKLDFFESIEIPLPSLDTQRAIVTQWEQAQAEVQRAEAQAAEREAQAQADFLAALGLSVPAQPQDKRRAFALNFSAMERWGVDVNQPGDKFDVAQGIYPVTALGDVIADLSNGWSPQCLNRPAQGNEWGVLKLGAVSFGRFDATENKAMPEGLKPMPSLEIKPGDWLISRANIARLVGACALVDKTPPHLLLCDKIFRAVWRSDSPALPAYLDAALKLPHLRHQIEGALTGTSPTMKNISKPALLALRLPLPPLDIQKALVEAIAQARTEAAQWRTRAAQVREQARLALERALLGASGENS